jgi:hypothetical protein
MPRKRVDVTLYPEAGRAVQAFQFRMLRPLKDAVDQAAARNNRSINAEIHARLQASFSEEKALGGPELHWLVTLVVAAFTAAGRMRAPGNPDWVDNPEARIAGTFTAIDALLAALPNMPPERVNIEIEGLRSALLTRVAREQMRQDAERAPAARKVA